MTDLRRKTLAACITLLAATLPMNAQKTLTLEDLNYGGTNYRNMVPENRWTAWWGDRLVHLDIEACTLVDRGGAKETPLFTLDEVNRWIAPQGGKPVRALYNAEFPFPDKSIAVVGLGSRTYTIDFKTYTLLDSLVLRDGQQLLEYNPNRTAYAYLQGDNLYVGDTDGHATPLSTDGSRDIVYGQSVHRNEFGIEKGTFWSPDGTRLAFYRMDQTHVTDYPQVDIPEPTAEHPGIATPAPDKYPMAGETSHTVTVGIYDRSTGKTLYLQAGDPTDRYFTNVAWSPDSKTVYMFELNRRQNDCRLTAYDAATGEKRGELYRETDEKYVEPLHPIQFLPWADDTFLMQSRKDGYNHLYLCTLGKDGRLAVRQLTEGSWEVLEVLGFNVRQKSVIIAANAISPIRRNLFAVSTKTGKRTLLGSERGWHNATLSHSGTLLVDNYSAPDVPRCIDLVETAKGKATPYFRAEDPWKGYTVPQFSCGTLKAADGHTDLYWRMVKPADFDPAKKYPTVVYVYGGPHAHNVDERWHYCSRGWESYMAGKGYITFILDNRGSEHRGKAFEQATWHRLGQEEMKDQMKGVEYLKSLPYVDADRIGVHGWSFGGFMTVSLMTHYPEVFKVGVAGGPVIDWQWYEVMYGERYMGTPQDNPDGYRTSSLIPQAKNLKGRLQIIQGLNDTTVVPQHCLSFLKACIAAGTQPDFFVYPGEPHNMRGHQSVHLHERITRYFEDYLK